MAASDGMKNEPVDGGGYTPSQIRALKIAIAIMTAAIFLGLAVMSYTILSRKRAPKTAIAPSSGSAAPIDLKTLYPGAGPIAQAQLPPGGRVATMAAWGDKLVLSVEDAAGTTLLALDPKTGRIEPLARLTPKP
jgi:hypothetical protein